MRILLLICFFLLGQGVLVSDPIRKRVITMFQRADELYANGHYSAALEGYLNIYKRDSLNHGLCYRIGECFFKSGKSLEKAEYFVRKSLKGLTTESVTNSKDSRDVPIQSYILLGDILHLKHSFEEAIPTYETFLYTLQMSGIKQPGLVTEVERKISISRRAIALKSQPVDVEITNLSKLNSDFPDYGPRLTADGATMIFTSRRPGNADAKTYDDGKYYEDVFLARKIEGTWKEIIRLGEPVNTLGNEAAVAVSADGQKILLYKDDLGDGNIYESKLIGDEWSVPVKLNGNINSPYWEPCGSLSSDGRTLFFVSDRPGGLGGTDIYKASRKADGDWASAINLGPTVNTKEDEYSPFLHPDGKTLFFSSRGHEGIGGYDVFFTSSLLVAENKWLAPVNLGYPINSAGDDVFYTVTTNYEKAYFSSIRPGGMGEKDNYELSFPEHRSAVLAIYKGKIMGHAEHAIITIADNRTQEIIQKIYPNSKTGEFTYVLMPGTSYNITYEAESSLFYSENFYLSGEKGYSENEIVITLPEISPGSSVTLSNVFFDYDKAATNPSSERELERIYNFLSQQPKVKVDFRGFADTEVNDDYNYRLSIARAESIKSYLVKRGIPSEKISISGIWDTPDDTNDIKKKEETLSTRFEIPDRRIRLTIKSLE